MMKKFIGQISLILLFLTISIPVFADSGGSEIIEENDYIDLEVVNSDSEFYPLRTPNSSYVYLTDGRIVGYWIRGEKTYSDGDYVYSSFKAREGVRDWGRASVTNGVGVYDDGGWKPAGTPSVARAIWTSSGTNKANYDFK